MRSMLFPALLALSVLVAGCSEDDGDARPNDRGDDNDPYAGGNLTVNGTGNGTTGAPVEEEVCDTDTSAQQVGDYYVKSNGPNQDVYEESNNMPDLQTPDTCPSNPDDQVAFAADRR